MQTLKTLATPPVLKKAALLLALIALMTVVAWLLWPQHIRTPPPLPDTSPSVSSTEPISPIPDSIPGIDPGKVALGKLLFHDTSLSQDNTIACASCHRFELGGADGKKYSIGIKGQLSLVNAPTVFNSTFNFRQFWDGRAETLGAQVEGPIHNKLEMGSNWSEVIAKLKKNAAYQDAFVRIYGSGITKENISDAIASFVQTLITPNSRFDKFLKGDTSAITAYEFSGYVRFTSYGCIACHQGMNIGGNLYEKLGIMRDYFADRGNVTEADRGLNAITNNPDDLHHFKVPSLRNVALTAPYLHDGSSPTLEKTVAIMGKYQLGISIPEDDIARIVAFLRTLTGEYNGKPL